MKIKTNIKAGSGSIGTGPVGNHNETLVRGQSKRSGLKGKTSIKAGSGAVGTGPVYNHNETLVRGM